MKKVILIFFASFLSVSAMAQSICGFDPIHQSAMQRDPAYKAAIEVNNVKLRKYIALNGNALRISVTTYTIPVVVHVVHTGGAVGTIYNPDDATIIATINYLNQVFKGTATGMSGGVGDMGLQFVLAQRDPNCNATSGIDRVDGRSLSGYEANGVNVPTSTNNISDLNLKNQSRWDPSKYYNIWVVNKIDGADGTAGQYTAGYAYFPESGNSDGTVMLATQMNINKKTLPHEMGHAFGLYHPFEGSANNTICPSNSNCTIDGDMVCDTDPIRANINLSGVLDPTCRTGTNPCTNTNYSINTENNFMGYTNCSTLFTAGQRDRVQATLLTFQSRISLVNSRAGLPCSNDANLSSLSINSSTISPSFSSSTYAYTAPITSNSSIAINVTKSSPYATLQGRINGGSYTTLTGSVVNAALGFGDNMIDFKVTAENGSTTNSYTITIGRPSILVTSFSPASASPGSTITIAGMGFNTTPANNIVFFGATRATVTAATATSVTVTVPVGATYAPITILNTGNGLAAYSLVNFTPTYSPPKTAITATDFLPKQDFTTGSSPYSVAIGDLDGDGKPDLAIVNSNSATVSVYRNTSTSGSIGSGSFAAKVDFTTGNSPFSVAIGDLDGDGKPDLAVVNNSSNTVSVFRNTATSGSIGTSSFAAKVDFTTGSSPRSVALGDLDGDGKIDLAIANYNSSTVSVFRNTSSTGSIGSGSFAAKVDFVTGTNAFSVATGDLDGDGKLDLAVANTTSNTISIFRNTSLSGTISFAAKQDYTTGNSPYLLALGDLDGDGKLDLAVANYYSSTISVFRNTSTSGSIGSSSFAAKVDFSTGTNTFSVAIGDLDGDGKPDMAVTNSSLSTVSVFRNTSTIGSITSGSFAANQDFTTGSSPFSVAIGDLDGDGKPDLAIANLASNSVSVIRNASNNANLSALSINSGSLSPTFNPATTSYSVSVNNATTSITVTPTVADATAAVQVRVNGGTYTSVTSGNASNPLALNVGNNPINVNVTAQDGTTIKTYVIVVTRISNNANLSALDISSGSLSPLFESATTSYTASVSNTTTNITVRPIVAVAGATVQVRVNGGTYTTVNSGNTSGALALNVGNNTIDVNVTASDGTTIKTYTIVVTRQEPLSIISFSPASAKPGDAVTITGTNFSTTASNNIVFFGATAGTVNTASATSLTVTVPIGATYAPITVINTEHVLSANTNGNFNPVFSPNKSSITTADFLAKVDFAIGTGSNPQAVAIGDIDGDGKSDLVTVNNGTNRVSVFRNTSTSGTVSSGSFAAKVDFLTGSNPSAIAIGDLDGDGKPELVVANSGSNSVSVFQNISNIGDISFADKVDFTAGTNPAAVAIGDLDGDGKPELVVANNGSNRISVLQNISDFGTLTSSSFAPKVDITTGSSPMAVAIGDLDGDNKTDIAVVNNGNNSVSVFRNTATSGTISSGSFAARVNFTTGSGPQAITFGDLEGDGKIDLVVANNGSRSVSVFRNTATSGAITTSSFATKVDFTTAGSGTNPQAVAIGDLNGDGKPDLAVASSGNPNGNIVSFFRNISTSVAINTSSFAAKVDFATGTFPISLAIGDLDGDGRPDLTLANNSSNSISVLRNADIPTWNGSTWLGGSPSVLTDAIIASSISPSSFTCQALTVNSGVALTTTGITATVNGNITNNGNGIAGTGSLIIAANSSISGNAISFNGTLTVNSGATLTTNNKLTISSNATATGRIANSAGTISGNVTVERYIPAGKRGFRFLTSPVTTSNFIKANWQEGATSSTANPTPGYGTHITGSTVDQTNGFDGTTTGAASMYTFNNATQAWNTGITNTNATNLIAGNAYRILIRGDRSFDLASTSASNTATTLRATGTLIAGAVSFGTASSSPSSLPTLASNASEYSIIGNPYASPIDWNALTKTGLTGYYYIWDPTLGTRGAYVSCFTDGTKSNSSSNITTAIQSGQAFFVQNTSGASARQLAIAEANKTAGNTNVFRTTTGTSTLNIQLYRTSNIASGASQDGANVLFNNSFSNEVNDDDASKFTNLDENIAIQRSNSLMSIERRHIPVPTDTVQLKVWQLAQNNYTFRIAANNFGGGLTAYLQDNYLNNETLLNLNGTTDVNFTTISATASTATDRFRIVFRTNNSLPATFFNVTAAQKNAGIEVVWMTANEVNMNNYEVEESTDGITFTKAVSVAAKNATTNSYSWFDATVVNGDNFYRIKSMEKNGTAKYSNVVKVKLGGKGFEFTVYPNPVKGGVVSLQMSNVEKGIYTIKTYNNLGQEVATKNINHNGGSATQTIDLGKGIASGTYNMQITNGTTVISKTVIVE